jgi:peptidoglycan hydrolase CwlO-like protein
MSIQDVKHFYENELDENEIELKKYKSYIDRLKTELKKYNEQNNSLNDENHKLKIEMKRIKKLLKDSGIVYN